MTYINEIFQDLKAEFNEKLLFGSLELMELFLTAYLSRGHLLIEGPPGTGKTLAAKLFAHKLARTFKRIQFTSDLLPGDLIGAHVYSPKTQDFHFIQGPLFADFILADEVNRTPPRVQSALLEAMEERQITTEGKTYALSRDFFVVATQNPLDMEGTFPLPEAQTDRFLFKIKVTHASPSAEEKMITGILEGIIPPAFDRIKPIAIDTLRLDAEVSAVRIDPSIISYVTKILDHTRRHPLLLQGSSVRGGIGLAVAAKVRALLQGRSLVTPDDIKYLALPVLRHRIKLSPEAQITNTSEDQVVQDILTKVEFPA